MIWWIVRFLPAAPRGIVRVSVGWMRRLQKVLHVPFLNGIVAVALVAPSMTFAADEPSASICRSAFQISLPVDPIPRPNPNAAYVALFREAFDRGFLTIQDLGDAIQGLEKGEDARLPFAQHGLRSAADGYARGFRMVMAHPKFQVPIALQKLRELEREVKASLPILQDIQKETRTVFMPSFERDITYRDLGYIDELNLDLQRDIRGVSWIVTSLHDWNFGQHLRGKDLIEDGMSQYIDTSQLLEPFVFNGKKMKFVNESRIHNSSAYLFDPETKEQHQIASPGDLVPVHSSEDSTLAVFTNYRNRTQSLEDTQLFLLELDGKRNFRIVDLSAYKYVERETVQTFKNSNGERLVTFHAEPVKTDEGQSLFVYNVSTGEPAKIYKAPPGFEKPFRAFATSKGEIRAFTVDHFGHLYFQNLKTLKVSEPWYIGWTVFKMPSNINLYTFSLDGRSYVTLPTQWLDSDIPNFVVIDLENPEKMFRISHYGERLATFKTAFKTLRGQKKLVFYSFEKQMNLVFVDFDDPEKRSSVAVNEVPKEVHYAVTEKREERLVVGKDVGTNERLSVYRLYSAPKQAEVAP